MVIYLAMDTRTLDQYAFMFAEERQAFVGGNNTSVFLMSEANMAMPIGFQIRRRMEEIATTTPLEVPDNGEALLWAVSEVGEAAGAWNASHKAWLRNHPEKHTDDSYEKEVSQAVMMLCLALPNGDPFPTIMQQLKRWASKGESRNGAALPPEPEGVLPEIEEYDEMAARMRGLTAEEYRERADAAIAFFSGGGE